MPPRSAGHIAAAFAVQFAASAALGGGCGAGGSPAPSVPPVAPAPSSTAPVPDPFADAEARARAPVEVPDLPAPPATLIRGGVVVTAAGARHAPGWVLLERGRIAAVGAGTRDPPPGAVVVEAAGRFVTPGIVDPHSHLGVYPSPTTAAHDDGNEMTDPVGASLRAEHGFWPQDPAIERAVAGGVTTIAVLPGSANLVGGRGAILHLVPHRGARAMRLPGAPEILKMACGENPKRIYKEQKRAPSTRMANVRNLREAFVRAQKYLRDHTEWARAHAGEADGGAGAGTGAGAGAGTGGDAGARADKPPDRDLGLETLALVLRGDILVEWHCYRADDMLAALQVADEFGFRVRAFHHALEAYKIRDVLARRKVAVATWADWYGFKMEAYDGVPENLALVHEAGGIAVVHSDSPVGGQVLNQEAGKALAAGKAAGVRIDEDDAVRWLTANPAWALGIDDQVGTIEPGKRGDVVVWSANPLSVYARALKVFVDGRLVLDADRPGAPWSDFEIGREERPARKDGGS